MLGWRSRAAGSGGGGAAGGEQSPGRRLTPCAPSPPAVPLPQPPAEMNLAFAWHEGIADHVTACLIWFQSGGTLDLNQLAKALAVVKLRDLTMDRVYLDWKDFQKAPFLPAPVPARVLPKPTVVPPAKNAAVPGVPAKPATVPGVPAKPATVPRPMLG